MNAVARILPWPVEPEDELPLALWDAGSKRGNLKRHAAGETAGRALCSEDWEVQWLRY